MRAEIVFRSRHITFKIGEKIDHFICDDEDESTVKSIAREKFRAYELEIKKIQKLSDEKLDGFILYQNNVYQVYATNGLVKKITGPVAKEIKRQIKTFS